MCSCLHVSEDDGEKNPRDHDGGGEEFAADVFLFQKRAGEENGPQSPEAFDGGHIGGEGVRKRLCDEEPAGGVEED